MKNIHWNTFPRFDTILALVLPIDIENLSIIKRFVSVYIEFLACNF